MLAGAASTSVDVVVVGGGHAGCEAAAAAARRGAKTLLITPSPSTSIGEMSCNPSIGGLAKGILVREVDALGGLQGWVADRSGIQFRMLNASKGPAVRGPRAQMDRALYKQHMQEALKGVPNLEIFDGAVTDLILDHRPPTATSTATASSNTAFIGHSNTSEGLPAVAGVVLASGERITCLSVVITTGTFLRGVIHVGSQSRPAGRIASGASNHAAAAAATRTTTTASDVSNHQGKQAHRVENMALDPADEKAAGAATQLAKTFAELGFQLGRLKTGTPPRIDGETLFKFLCTVFDPIISKLF